MGVSGTSVDQYADSLPQPTLRDGLMERLHDDVGFVSLDLGTEAGRFAARDLIAALLRPWFERRDLATVRERVAGTGVSWEPYQTFRQLVTEDPRVSTANPLFSEVEQPGVGRYLMPASPLDFSEVERVPARRAPLLGEHTEEILAETLGLGTSEIGRLFDAGVVASNGTS